MDENIVIYAEESGDRVDALLARHIEELSRSAAQRLLEEGRVLLRGAPVKKNYKCAAGDAFFVQLPPAEEVALVAQDIPLDVVYEDGDVIVVNKPRGLVVHPAPGHPDGTLVNALLWHCGDSLSGVGGEKRPGIVHRIDKDTSGLLIAAKNDFAASPGSTRPWCAGGCGRIPARSTGRSAATRSIASAWPSRRKTGAMPSPTGRCWRATATIRTSAAGWRPGAPIRSAAPSPEKGLEGQCLHARELKFIHPRTGEGVRLETPLPAYFTEVLSKLGAKE